MFSLEELVSNCFFLLLCSNLTAKFGKKHARFTEINQNLDSTESARTFPEIFNNIPWNLLEHFPESSHTFHGIPRNIPQSF